MDGIMTSQPNNLEAFWMPFTVNRQFKKAPRLLVSAEGMYYTSADGRKVLDGTAGLWCVNAGHGRPRDHRGGPRSGRPTRLCAGLPDGPSRGVRTGLAPDQPAAGADLDHVFFTNSGSESVDTALKIALAYHRVRGEGTRTAADRARARLSRRRLRRHLGRRHRHQPQVLRQPADRRRSPAHTHNIAKQRLQPRPAGMGRELADELERLVDAARRLEHRRRHRRAGRRLDRRAGPAEGLSERLREICDKHGILLIFDEVITGFGRLGASFATEYFGVMPDIITTAKGITNGTIPMGAVFVRKDIYDAFMTRPGRRHRAVPRLHLFRPSASPAPPASPRWTSTRKRGCSSARRELAPLLGRRASIAEGRAATSSTCATSA